jgi:hypothetical protein
MGEEVQERTSLVKRGLTVLHTHPFQIAVGGMFLVAGIKMALLLLTGAGFGLLALPPVLVALWCVMIFVGGALMVLGARGSIVSPTSRGLEKAGCILGGMAFFTLAIAVLVLLPFAWDTWMQCFIVSLGCFFRLSAVGQVDRGMGRVARKK